MRTNLLVRFEEKNEAKKLGAKWDAARKVWYVENVPNMSLFKKWLPNTKGSSSTDFVPKKVAPTKKMQSSGTIIIGSAYVEQLNPCPHPPWEVCKKCRATAFNI